MFDVDERPKYKMRFVGFNEHGELKPTAPGTFKKNEIRMLPLEYAQNFWWELVDAIPDLVIPETLHEESVFVEDVFVPPEDISPEEQTAEVDTDEGPLTEIQYDQMNVASLKLFIKQYGGEVNSKWLKADLIKEARKLRESSRAASKPSQGEPKQWWLISDEDVQMIRTGLTARTDTRRRMSEALHALDSGLHKTEAIPDDWKKS